MNSSLSYLSLSDNKFGDIGTVALSESITTAKATKSRSLKPTGGTENSNTSNLKSLELMGNKIGNTGIAAIIQCLKSNKVITSLDIRNNSNISIPIWEELCT